VNALTLYDDFHVQTDTLEEQKQAYVVFKVGGELYAISMQNVKEVIFYCDPVLVPYSPEYVMGLINIRGSLIPIVDLKNIFRLTSDDDAIAKQIVVVKHGKVLVGFAVDSMCSSEEFCSKDVQENDEIFKEKLSEFIFGQIQYGKDVVGILNISKMIEETRIKKN
jgi:purine-binding chemotaxis protein CheW